ncbi:hypothetical protein GC176_28210 [bacterium]|nr:hypothetical protein [bacterium]
MEAKLVAPVWDFVSILDIIHAVTHIFASTLADRTEVDGWPIDEQWIRWIWNSQFERVITTMYAHDEALRRPAADDDSTNVRSIVSTAPGPQQKSGHW